MAGPAEALSALCNGGIRWPTLPSCLAINTHSPVLKKKEKNNDDKTRLTRLSDALTTWMTWPSALRHISFDLSPLTHTWRTIFTSPAASLYKINWASRCSTAEPSKQNIPFYKNYEVQDRHRVLVCDQMHLQTFDDHDAVHTIMNVSNVVSIC